jgi:hypothetical protein
MAGKFAAALQASAAANAVCHSAMRGLSASGDF